MSTRPQAGVQEWRDIDWPKVESNVHTLQRRIYQTSHKIELEVSVHDKD